MVKRFFVLLCLSFLCSYALIYSVQQLLVTDKGEVQAERIAITPTPSPHIIKPFVSYLKIPIDTVLEGSKGTYGIAVKNLKTGESYYFNEHRKFEAASLYKTWILKTAIDQIQDGKLKEDQILSQDVQTLNKKFAIGSESAEMKEGRVTFTVAKAMEQMIIISHNYAALLLSEKVGLSNVKEMLVDNYFTETSIGSPPKTTAFDMASYFEKLYRGELADKELSDEMLTLYKRQRLNHKLPKYLPLGTVVAHKTGEMGTVTHDAGIVYTPKGDYIIVVLTESYSRLEAEERIAQISRAVYDYFMSN